MTYPKMNVASVTFVAEKTNSEFATWMPLYQPNVPPHVREDSEMSEGVMMQAKKERSACFVKDAVEEMWTLTTLATSIAFEMIGSASRDDSSAERKCVEIAEEIVEKFDGLSLLALTREFTREEWELIYPGVRPHQGWVGMHARALADDVLEGIVANVVEAVKKSAKKNRKHVDDANARIDAAVSA